jgi:hypothetical protein
MTLRVIKPAAVRVAPVKEIIVLNPTCFVTLELRLIFPSAGSSAERSTMTPM